MATEPPRPTFFTMPAEFRRWLERYHDSKDELWVGFHKKGSGQPSLTWSEAVDEALCFGWIDGIRKRVDDNRYTNRFTPRRRGSIWSAFNTRRARELIRAGRMRPAGLQAFKARDPKKTAIYSFEQRNARQLEPAAAALLKKNRAAWSFFESQPPSYRRTVVYWIATAKKEETRARRLDTLITACAAGRRLGQAPRDKK